MEKYNHNYTIKADNERVDITLGNLSNAGWYMYTDNVGVGISIGVTNDEFVKDIKDFDFDMIAKKIEETKDKQGDLNLIYWLSGGNGFWSEGFYHMIENVESYKNDGLEEGEEGFEEFTPNKDKDKLQEELKESWIPYLFDEVIPKAKECKTNEEKWETFIAELEQMKSSIRTDIEDKLYEMVV